MIVSFNRNNINSDADLGEKMGDFCLGLLRISFGKTLTVQSLKSHRIVDSTEDQVLYIKSERVFFVIEKIETVVKKVFTGALFFLGLPVTLILAGIGLVSIACSKSYHTYLEKYLSFDPETLQQDDRPIKYTSSDKHRILGFNIIKNRTFIEEGKYKQIIKKLPISRVEDITIPAKIDGKTETPSWDLQIRYTENNKAIIQQETIDSCAPTSVAMLVMDNNRTPDWDSLQLRNAIGLTAPKIAELLEASVSPMKVVTKEKIESLIDLKEAIKKDGSAICFIGGHAIVVDNINESTTEVTIRDPQNGCESTVKGEEFIKERGRGWDGHKFTIIQIENGK